MNKVLGDEGKENRGEKREAEDDCKNHLLTWFPQKTFLAKEAFLG